ncbi:ABC transporter permease [Anaerolinea thermophila]|uniref:ABC transporter permease n=1 Tax=Anaerolinea thermophila TaxID=167964 RepID=UPI0026EDC66A|nr:ABC transporter permease [Anaerolinea thermophila]
MRKAWIVFLHEYVRHVKNKRFLFGLLSLPLAILLMTGVAIAAVFLSFDFRPVGVIDRSGLFQDAQSFKEMPFKEISFFLQVLPYDDEEAARRALDQGDIQAFFIIEPDYLTTGKVRSISQTGVDSIVTDVVSQYLLTHLLKNENPLVKTRILEGPRLEFETLDGKEPINNSSLFTSVLIFLFGIIFFFSINITGNYLLQALVDEKENRTIEILFTSLSTDQLMIGKIFGNLSVGLTQIFFWFAIPLALGVFALRTLPLPNTLNLDLSAIRLMMLLAVPAFIMVSALMMLAGATATEAREAQQVVALFSMLFFIPLFILDILIENPDSPLSIGFSFFPFTAPLMLPLRSVVTRIPFWQIAVSEGILVLCAAGAIWLASRAFRLGMLRYGKKVTLMEIFRSRVS